MTKHDPHTPSEREPDPREFPVDIGSYRTDSGELVIFDEYLRTAWISSADCVQLHETT